MAASLVQIPVCIIIAQQQNGEKNTSSQKVQIASSYVIIMSYNRVTKIWEKKQMPQGSLSSKLVNFFLNTKNRTII